MAQQGTDKKTPTPRTPYDFAEFSALGKRAYELEVIEEKEDEEEEKEEEKKGAVYWTLGGKEKQREAQKEEEEEKGESKNYYEKLKETTGRTPFEFSYVKM